MQKNRSLKIFDKMKKIENQKTQSLIIFMDKNQKMIKRKK